jgi:predicted acyl esterase
VQWLGWDDGNFMGWVQWTSNCGAPPALKATVTICSTDDRYADDVHYMGGTLLPPGLDWAFFFSA